MFANVTVFWVWTTNWKHTRAHPIVVSCLRTIRTNRIEFSSREMKNHCWQQYNFNKCAKRLISTFEKYFMKMKMLSLAHSLSPRVCLFAFCYGILSLFFMKLQKFFHIKYERENGWKWQFLFRFIFIHSKLFTPFHCVCLHFHQSVQFIVQRTKIVSSGGVNVIFCVAP